MEAILKFTLPDEKSEFEITVKAQALHSVLWEYKQYLRDELKHNDKLTAKQSELLKRCQNKFFEILNDNGILLDK
jgi:hypothetical protein